MCSFNVFNNSFSYYKNNSSSNNNKNNIPSISRNDNHKVRKVGDPAPEAPTEEACFRTIVLFIAAIRVIAPLRPGAEVIQQCVGVVHE
jgi:hypothetical protein